MTHKGFKKCLKCGEKKEISSFSKSRSQPDGLFWCCKQCAKEYQKEYRKKNREQLRLASRNNHYRFYEKYKERYKLYRNKYRGENKEYFIAYQKKEVFNLTDHYIAQQLQLKKSECTPELIELKRASIQLLRACK